MKKMIDGRPQVARVPDEFVPRWVSKPEFERMSCPLAKTGYGTRSMQYLALDGHSDIWN